MGVFDVDRTLTGAHGAHRECPRNVVVDNIIDRAYGTGPFTLSALAAEGISTTFCGECYLGICSAGNVGGYQSAERQYIVEHILRTSHQDALVRVVPSATAWSHGTHVQSPLVYGQPDTIKQEAVNAIRQWYQAQHIAIKPENVYFFGDRTENIKPFAELGFNAREISCGSRDLYQYGGSEIIGFCGARPQEIIKSSGIALCSNITIGACTPSQITRRRRASHMCSCRRRSNSEDLSFGLTCSESNLIVGDMPFGG